MTTIEKVLLLINSDRNWKIFAKLLLRCCRNLNEIEKTLFIIFNLLWKNLLFFTIPTLSIAIIYQKFINNNNKNYIPS